MSSIDGIPRYRLQRCVYLEHGALRSWYYLCSKLLSELSSSLLHRYNSRMAGEPKLSHTAAMILQAIHAGHIYGFSVMEAITACGTFLRGVIHIGNERTPAGRSGKVHRPLGSRDVSTP